MIDLALWEELQKHKGKEVSVVRIESIMHNEFILNVPSINETMRNYLERVTNCNPNARHQIKTTRYTVDELGTPIELSC